jgi:P27 family predicted phage terminase small subunit
MRGRKPKPPEIRRREGMAGHRPIPEPVVVHGRPADLEPPDHLPEASKLFWREVVPVLGRVGILDGVDRPMLEMAAVPYARARQAGKVVAEQGHVTRGSAGQLAEHPLVATERNAMALFMKFAESYALTPVARTRLGLAELQRRSLVDELDDELGESRVRRR